MPDSACVPTANEPQTQDGVTWAYSMTEMLAAARARGHAKFAAADVNAQRGTKKWASFADARALFEYITGLPEKQRCIYEVILDTTPVCLWFDIEFLSPDEAEGEKRRAFLDAIVREAVEHSFGLRCPVMVWGTSTRWDAPKDAFKHSYQLRVRDVRFHSNAGSAALGMWVKRLVRETSAHQMFLCPRTGKHVIDTVVYSRMRCVRTMLSMKKNDPTGTALRLMDTQGAQNAQGALYEQFCALLVEAPPPAVGEPGACFIGADHARPVPCRVPSLGVAVDEVMAGEIAARKRKNGLPPTPAEQQQQQQQRAAKRIRHNFSSQVIEYLARLGANVGERYEDWSKVMFCVRNSSEGTRALQAFIEWSKQAMSFTSAADIENAFLACDVRSMEDDLPCLKIDYLRKLAETSPGLAFSRDRSTRVDEASLSADNIGESLDLFTLMASLDVRKSCWRTLVRAAKILWPAARNEVVDEIHAAVENFQDGSHVTRDAVERVWNYDPCQCKYYTECLVADIQRQLFWPKLVTKNVPALLRDALRREVEVVSFECDEVDSLVVRIRYKDEYTEDVAPYARKKFTISLKTGRILGTKLSLSEASFMFNAPRNPLELKNEYSLEAQVNWAKRLCTIPRISENLRCIQKGPWCIYSRESGVWTEMEPKSAALKLFLSDEVKTYFETLHSFLDFKSQFDVVADGQRQLLEKIFTKFSNNDFLDKILDALEASNKISVKSFHDVFNANPHMIPCQNGILDFRTLQLRPLQRDDFFTYRVSCHWDPDADTTEPEAFIASLFPYDTAEIVRFVVTWLGYCMTGLTFMQICTFFIGYGSNGKSKVSQVMEHILGPVAFAKVSYEALCQKSDRPNEEIYEARNARMWQIDENSDDTVLNYVMIKKISGEDGMNVRRLYGHQVKVPPRAKLNFSVNKNPRLPASSSAREQSALSRRFIYVDCPVQFVDFSPGGKDTKKIEAFRQEFSKEHFEKCVRQVDVNMDAKLKRMHAGFFRLFAKSIHAQYRENGDGGWDMEPIAVPVCLQQQVDKMMRCNPSLKADEFLNTYFEPGVIGEVRVWDMYRQFLEFHQLEDNNFGLSRFETDLSKWAALQNNTHPNCKQNGLIVKKNFYKRGKWAGQSFYKNLCRVADTGD